MTNFTKKNSCFLALYLGSTTSHVVFFTKKPLSKIFIHITLYIALLLRDSSVLSQILLPDRRTNWEHAGIAGDFPDTEVAISCLKIERNDATAGQTSNIHFRYAAGCQVQGIESDRCNFSHVTMSYSHGIKISGSYFHHSFSYGSGGKAYGVKAGFLYGVMNKGLLFRLTVNKWLYFKHNICFVLFTDFNKSTHAKINHIYMYLPVYFPCS